MSTLTFYDAAWPPSSPPRTDGVCIYIGGDTPHVWTRGEIAAQPARYRLPIWVRSDPQAVNPLADAAACLAALRAMGAPKGTLVALDSETSVDPAWVHTFVEAVNQGGYPVIDYGSQSTVFGNRNPDGYYWGADWTGTPHIYPGDQMTQWVSFAAIDESESETGLPFWDTRPGPPPPPPSNWTEAMIANLPTLQNGAADSSGHRFVHRVQGLCAALSAPTVIDGSFGPATESAVKVVQRQFGITEDGVVGPATWGCLVAGQPA